MTPEALHGLHGFAGLSEDSAPFYSRLSELWGRCQEEIDKAYRQRNRAGRMSATAQVEKDVVGHQDPVRECAWTLTLRVCQYPLNERGYANCSRAMPPSR